MGVLNEPLLQNEPGVFRMSRCYNRAVGGKNELVLTNEPMVLSRLTNEPGCLGYEPVHTNDLGVIRTSRCLQTSRWFVITSSPSTPPACLYHIRSKKNNDGEPGWKKVGTVRSKSLSTCILETLLNAVFVFL